MIQPANFADHQLLLKTLMAKLKKLLVISTKFIGPKHRRLSCKMSLGVVRSKDRQLYLQGKLGGMQLTYFYSKTFQSRYKNIGNSHFLHGFMAKYIPRRKYDDTVSNCLYCTNQLLIGAIQAVDVTFHQLLTFIPIFALAVICSKINFSKNWVLVLCLAHGHLGFLLKTPV